MGRCRYNQCKAIDKRIPERTPKKALPLKGGQRKVTGLTGGTPPYDSRTTEGRAIERNRPDHPAPREIRTGFSHSRLEKGRSKMKHSNARIAAAGLVTAFAVVAALLAGFTPTNATAQATAAVGDLVEATPTVKIPAEIAPAAQTAARKRTATTISTTAVKASSKAALKTAYQSTTGELGEAKAILAGLIKKYPILKGTTVTIGTTPGGYQAVAYYKSGRIIISPKHTASLSRILNHEIWHIIDWRDNGRIDWGENVPPR